MSKRTIDFMYGVAFGFLGIILYAFAQTGYEYVGIRDVLNMLKEAALPFIFTEMWVAIASEGIGNLVTSFKNYIKKLEAKRNSKKVEQA